MFQTEVTYEVVWSLVGEFLHLTMQVYTTDTYLCAYHINIQVAIAEVGVDNGKYAVEKLLVSTFNLDIVDMLAMVLLASELILHESA